MNITESTSLDIKNTTRYVINVENGTLEAVLNTGGATSTLAVTEPSEILVPAESTLTFNLNGDTATVTRL